MGISLKDLPAGRVGMVMGGVKPQPIPADLDTDPTSYMKPSPKGQAKTFGQRSSALVRKRKTATG